MLPTGESQGPVPFAAGGAAGALTGHDNGAVTGRELRHAWRGYRAQRRTACCQAGRADLLAGVTRQAPTAASSSCKPVTPQVHPCQHRISSSRTWLCEDVEDGRR